MRKVHGSSALSLEFRTALGLSPSRIKYLREYWNAWLPNDMAFAPSELVERGRITRELNETVQGRFGRFASAYKIKILAENVPNIFNPYSYPISVLSFGFGKGHDSHWIPHALKLGLNVKIWDVSTYAVENGRPLIKEMMQDSLLKGCAAAGTELLDSTSILREGEAETILAEESEFEAESVWFLDFTRLINCNPVAAQKRILRHAGYFLSLERDSRKDHRIMIIQQYDEDNPGIHYGRARHSSLRRVLANLRIGARRKVIAEEPAAFDYFSSLPSKRVIKAYTFRAA